MLLKRNTEDFAYIGGQKVEVKKLPVVKYQQIFGALNQLPGIIFSAMTESNKKNIGAIMIAAVDVCFDEVVEILAIASGLDKAYIKENAALDEMVDYVYKLIQKNNFPETLKKLKAAGNLLFPQMTVPEKADQTQA